jgi:adenylosuccinate synthase
VGYEYRGKRLKTFPADTTSLEHITPVYEEYDGWKTPLPGVTSYNKLPVNARQYLEAIGTLTGTRVWLASVGPRRDQTLFVDKR